MLMYALGPCLFTSTNTHHEYHATFFHELAVRTSHNMFGSHLELKISETKTAIEAYISVIADKHQDDRGFHRFASLYEERVFPENPNSLYITINATLPKMAMDIAFKAFDICRDAYYQLDTGLTYAQFAAVEHALSESTKGSVGSDPATEI